MSETAAPRVTKVRPARVWQASELARSSALTKGFVAQSWSVSSARVFALKEVPDVSSANDPAAQQFEISGADAAALALALPDDDVAELSGPAETLASSELLESVRAQAYAQGVADTQISMREAMEQELRSLQAQDQSMLGALETALDQLKRSPQQFFEPLKRLAVHLAEQLVLAELSLDGKAIERLVQRCIDELSSHDESMVVVELHPGDLALLKALRERLGLNRGVPIKLKADASLLPGSARASANDSMVQDLIEHRLTELAKALGVDQARWKSNSAFEPEQLASQHAGALGVEDALPRMAASTPVAPAVDPSFFENEATPDEDDV